MVPPVKAREKILAIANHALIPALKREGFRKSGLNFARRRGAVGHFLQLQLSPYNLGASGQFCVNVGVMFDEVRAHFGRDIPVLPKYVDCFHDFLVRVRSVHAESPDWWTVDADSPVPLMSDHLVHCVENGCVEPRNRVSTLADFEHIGWVKAVPWRFPAVYSYLLGRDEQASALVQAEADFFRDRGVTYEGLLEKYRKTTTGVTVDAHTVSRRKLPNPRHRPPHPRP